MMTTLSFTGEDMVGNGVARSIASGTIEASVWSRGVKGNHKSSKSEGILRCKIYIYVVFAGSFGSSERWAFLEVSASVAGVEAGKFSRADQLVLSLVDGADVSELFQYNVVKEIFRVET